MPLESQLISAMLHRRSRAGRLLGAVAGAVLLVQAPGTPAAAVPQGEPELEPRGKAAAAPTYEIRRYEIAGSTLFTEGMIDDLMRDGVGANVSLLQIRRALVRLQEAYRELGYTRVLVTMPRQSLTDGIVRIQIVEDSKGPKPGTSPAPEVTAWPAPSYDVRHFEIRGNTALTAEDIDRILGPAADAAATAEQLQKALGQLQAAYREHGLSFASVKLPQQLLTDGTVVIEVDEGRSADADSKAGQAPRPQPPAPPPPRTFEVRRFEVAGNTLLLQATVDQILNQATGTNISIQQIQKAVGELQLAYRERGFTTVGVGLPQQQLTNATVRVQVTEGKLAEIRVSGNRYFSSNNVLRTLPSIQQALARKDETVVNSRVIQRELDIANQNRDRQIYPVISPGLEPGTSALELRVKDRLPLHGRLEVNNYSTPGTPDWRINATAQYNNLWQREHQFGLSYGFTPEAMKSDGFADDFFINRPLISYGGAYYRLPLGGAESVQDRINSSTRFGYDEAAHQFNLPPAGSRADLTVYASASSSDTGVKRGPLSPI
jgi:hemolysin activation/secretion protein